MAAVTSTILSFTRTIDSNYAVWVGAPRGFEAEYISDYSVFPLPGVEYNIPGQLGIIALQVPGHVGPPFESWTITHTIVIELTYEPRYEVQNANLNYSFTNRAFPEEAKVRWTETMRSPAFNQTLTYEKTLRELYPFGGIPGWMDGSDFVQINVAAGTDRRSLTDFVRLWIRSFEVSNLRLCGGAIPTTSVSSSNGGSVVVSGDHIIATAPGIPASSHHDNFASYSAQYRSSGQLVVNVQGYDVKGADDGREVLVVADNKLNPFPDPTLNGAIHYDLSHVSKYNKVVKTNAPPTTFTWQAEAVFFRITSGSYFSAGNKLDYYSEPITSTLTKFHLVASPREGAPYMTQTAAAGWPETTPDAYDWNGVYPQPNTLVYNNQAPIVDTSIKLPIETGLYKLDLGNLQLKAKKSMYRQPVNHDCFGGQFSPSNGCNRLDMKYDGWVRDSDMHAVGDTMVSTGGTAFSCYANLNDDLASVHGNHDRGAWHTNFRPYRWLYLTYNNPGGKLKAQLKMPTSNGIKQWSIAFPHGSGTLHVDLCNPTSGNWTTYTGSLTPEELHQLNPKFDPYPKVTAERAHWDDQAIETRAQYGVATQNSSHRFGGIAYVRQAQIAFDTGTLTLSDWGLEVRYGAKCRPYISIMKGNTSLANWTGHYIGWVDGRDAFRTGDGALGTSSSEYSGSIAGYLKTYQGVNVVGESATLTDAIVPSLRASDLIVHSTVTPTNTYTVSFDLRPEAHDGASYQNILEPEQVQIRWSGVVSTITCPGGCNLIYQPVAIESDVVFNWAVRSETFSAKDEKHPARSWLKSANDNILYDSVNYTENQTPGDYGETVLKKPWGYTATKPANNTTAQVSAQNLYIKNLDDQRQSLGYNALIIGKEMPDYMRWGGAVFNMAHGPSPLQGSVHTTASPRNHIISVKADNNSGDLSVEHRNERGFFRSKLLGTFSGLQSAQVAHHPDDSVSVVFDRQMSDDQSDLKSFMIQSPNGGVDWDTATELVPGHSPAVMTHPSGALYVAIWSQEAWNLYRKSPGDPAFNSLGVIASGVKEGRMAMEYDRTNRNRIQFVFDTESVLKYVVSHDTAASFSPMSTIGPGRAPAYAYNDLDQTRYIVASGATNIGYDGMHLYKSTGVYAENQAAVDDSSVSPTWEHVGIISEAQDQLMGLEIDSTPPHLVTLTSQGVSSVDYASSSDKGESFD